MKKRIVIFGVLGFVLYFFIFATPLDKESYLYPQESVSLNEVQGKLTGSSPLYGFSLGSHFGYLGADFNVEKLMKSNQRVVFNNEYYTFYDAQSTESPLYTADGLKTATIADPESIPFLYGKRLFMIDGPNGIIKSFNMAGNLLWTYATGDFIISIDFSEEAIVCGLQSGQAQFLDMDGKYMSDYRPGGSRIDSIYGVALSSSGRYAALVSGLDPQRFVLLEKRQFGYTPIYHTSLSQAYNRAVHITFSGNERYVSYEEEGFFHTYDIKLKKANFVPVEGALQKVVSDIFPGFHALLSKQGSQIYLKIVSYDGFYPLLMTHYATNNNYLAAFGKNFIFGANDKLMLVERGKE